MNPQGLMNSTIDGLVFLRKKLITKEDRFWIHKIFGIFALYSFIYRYGVILPQTGTLGFENGTLFDYVTLLGHLLLSCSSLVFHVLEKRIVSNPLIIYEEYRLHAMVFTSRAVCVSIVGMLMSYIPETMRWAFLVGTVLIHHIGADLISKHHGTHGVTAVRNTNNSDKATYLLGYSYYQFVALGAHLLMDDKLCDLGFNAIIAIQSSAFLMTLKRKGVIAWYSHAFWYSFCLVLSMYYMWLVKGSLFFFIVLACFAIRVKFNTNKYAIWLGFILAHATFPSLATTTLF